jgi:hypothetical protein
MKIDEFDRTIDGYIEADPRDYLKVGLKRADERERSDIPEETFDTIAGPLRQRLAERAERQVKRRDYDRIDALLTEYAVELRAAIGWHRREGMLKPMTAESEVKRIANAGFFQKFYWNGWEVKALNEFLENGEQILEVDFYKIVTSKRTIARAGDFFDAGRPSGYSKQFWMGNATPAARLAEAEAAAKRDDEVARRPFSSTSGPHAGVETVVQR